LGRPSRRSPTSRMPNPRSSPGSVVAVRRADVNTESGRGGRGGAGEKPLPGLLATWIAGRLLVLVGRDARPSRANIRHPPPRSSSRRSHSCLTACPRTGLAGHGQWRVRNAPSARAASLASSAACRSRPGATVARRLTPTSLPPSIPMRAGCVPVTARRRVHPGHALRGSRATAPWAGLRPTSQPELFATQRGSGRPGFDVKVERLLGAGATKLAAVGEETGGYFISMRRTTCD
jgi:hypothetical protein